MFDAKQLLDQFIGTGGMPGQGGQQQTGQAPSQQGGVAGGVQKAQGFAAQNPLLSGAAAGGIAALLLGSKGGRKIGKKAVKYGGMALVGGLAYKAYQNYQTNKQGGAGAPPPVQPASAPQQHYAEPDLLPPPTDSAFASMNAPQGENTFALAIISAMISAAKADGHIDATEQARIFEAINKGGLDAEAKAFLMDELSAPLDIQRIVASAQNEEQAVEIYAASLMAIDLDRPEEQRYLNMLAAGLGLDPALKAEIEANIMHVYEAT